MPKPKVLGGKDDQRETPQEVYQRTRPRGGIRASCGQNQSQRGSPVQIHTHHKLYVGWPV